MWRALCCLWMLSLLSLFHWAGADDDFCNRPINMDLCYKRLALVRVARALTDDHFLRFGRNHHHHPNVRLEKDDAQDLDSNLGNALLLAIARARAKADDLPLHFRARRSVPQPPAAAAPPETETDTDTAATATADAVNSDKEGVAAKPVADSAAAAVVSSAKEGKPFIQEDEVMTKDKKFMRFGKRHPPSRVRRNPEEGDQEDGPAKRFMRFGKRFMRFGKRFMRFGRSGPQDEDMQQDKRFMRFGKRFMRFGRVPSEKRFMRFGRGGEEEEEEKDADNYDHAVSGISGDLFVPASYNPLEAGKRFMRFGRAPALDKEKRFMRFGRDPAMENEKRFMRFGRDPLNNEKRFMRFGKRFMRFGRGSGEEQTSEGKRFMRFGRGGAEGVGEGEGALTGYEGPLRLALPEELEEDIKSNAKRFMRFGRRESATPEGNDSEISS
ncbi:uncharacterized protein LOC143286428 isoform X1 [Babylonia areolata]|uniref:uncharacterized protein LOC143286428 isoform X1 n=1 Tax=Babylonia areolata TaxID=304850 RepID=UPI003FD66F3B